MTVTGAGNGSRSAGGRRALLAAASVYLVLGVALWWNAWSTHPSAVTTCGCGDAARFLWYFRWPAFALAHGHDVLYSTYLFHPGGINLLDDTSVVALGTVFAPVTLVAGPVASMNVALTLAPVLSALSMFVLLRRWVRWAPAALLGGLAYGFSPFMVTELALNQLNIAFLAVPPLIVLTLADLLVYQRRRPWVDGVGLAGLVVVQFFVSTEILVITGLSVLVGVVLLVVWAAWRRPAELSSRMGRAAAGAGVAVGSAAALLAYPLWFLLDGPAHLVGPIWSAGATTRYGTSLSSFVSTAGLAYLRIPMVRFGGYQGPVLVGLGYLGLGVLAVAVVGMVVWRRDRRLLLFAGVGLVAAVLSLGPGHGYPVPWDALQHVPWIGDVVEVRFTLVVTFCVAVLAALSVDHARHALGAREDLDRGVLGAVSWLLVIVVLAPTLVVLWPNLPLTTEAVVLPTWFVRRGAVLPPGRVVLAYPIPSSGLQSSEAWQAVNAMRWAQASGGGPQGQPDRAGAARPGFEVLSAASLPLGPAPIPTATTVAAVRSALRRWKVTTVVVPDQPGLPAYELGRGGPYAAGFFTAVLGELPTHVDRAWVWGSVGSAPAAAPVSAPGFAACTSGPVASAGSSAVPSCVLAAAMRAGG
ncbi:MAG: hypothetical protein ABSB09_10375 [Acidimicrobiales bacterium]